MSLLLGVLLFAAVVVLIMLPFFQEEERGGGGEGGAEALAARKEAVYGSLKDIEMDYQMGKLSREDYEALRAAYRQKALDLLKAIDRPAPPPLDDRIEREVAAYRRRRADQVPGGEGLHDES